MDDWKDGDQKPTVVIVDDSAEVRDLVRIRLELSDLFEVVAEGKDGDEAMTLAYLHEPDLMLLDTSMPTLDGLEALPGILALSPETRVVMFTGFEGDGLAARARELGAVDFVEKSIRLEDLTTRLLHALDGVESGPPRLRVARDDQPRPASGGEQAVLDEHLEQFRELFDRAAIGMATLTLYGTIVRANHTLAELMSCKPSDLVGEDYGRITSGQGDVLDQRLEAINTMGEDLTTFEHRLPAPRDDRTVRVTLAPIRDSRGQALYVFAQVQDITAQRLAEEQLHRSEETFRFLVSAVTEYAIFLLDPEGRVMSWNAGAERIKGYTADEICEQHFRVFYPPEEQESRHPEHNLELAFRNGQYAEEGWRVRKDGSRFWASVVLTAVYDDEGGHLGFAKVTRDQTEQRDAEIRRQRAIEQQTHLLSVTAHELRTPTAVIEGAAGMLQDHWERLTQDRRDRFLAGIRGSTRRLHRLVSDLSTASRLQSDQPLTLRLERVSLADMIRGARDRAKLSSPSVQVEVELPEFDVEFDADPGRLAQAVDNLVDNAMRHGTPPVTLSGTAGHDTVHIRVSDRGPGVAEELLPQLFEQFAIAGPTGATGLGLYLVREIARRHDGEASYHPPTQRRPATFEISLPCRQ